MSTDMDDVEIAAQVAAFVTKVKNVCQNYHPAIALEGMAKLVGSTIGTFSKDRGSVDQGVAIAVELLTTFADMTYRMRKGEPLTNG